MVFCGVFSYFIGKVKSACAKPKDASQASKQPDAKMERVACVYECDAGTWQCRPRGANILFASVKDMVDDETGARFTYMTMVKCPPAQ